MTLNDFDLSVMETAAWVKAQRQDDLDHPATWLDTVTCTEANVPGDAPEYEVDGGALATLTSHTWGDGRVDWRVHCQCGVEGCDLHGEVWREIFQGGRGAMQVQDVLAIAVRHWREVGLAPR